MDNRDSGTIYFIAGLLLGGIVGAGVGLLVAPESGDKTMAKLKREGGKIVKKSLTALDELEKTQLEPALDKVTKQVKGKFEDVKTELTASL